MKHSIRQIVTSSLAISLISMGAYGQDKPTTDDPMVHTPTKRHSVDDTLQSSSTAGTVLRGSTLIGCEVQNSAGEDIGEVHDLVVDDRGSIKAVLLECDRFDDGYVAVPLSVLTLQYEEAKLESDGSLPRDRKVKALVLNAAQVRNFESSPRTRLQGPLDSEFIRRVNEHFGTTTAYGQQPGDHTMGKDAMGNDTTRRDTMDGDNKRHDAMDQHSESTKLCLVSKVLDKDVTNSADEDVGEIEDLAVSVDRAEVVYAVMESGGFLGVGEKRFAVPWMSIETPRSDSDTKVRLNVTKESLAQADGFEHWPATGDVYLFRQARSMPTEGTRIGSEQPARTPSGTARRDS